MKEHNIIDDYDFIDWFFSDCSERKAVGFDCEWIGQRVSSKYGKLLIVSLCTPQGYCALFRMNKFRTIPKCLKVNILFPCIT